MNRSKNGKRDMPTLRASGVDRPVLIRRLANERRSLPAFGGTNRTFQKLEKTLAGDRDASARADAVWQLGQLGATDSWPAAEIAEDDRQCPVVGVHVPTAIVAVAIDRLQSKRSS